MGGATPKSQPGRYLAVKRKGRVGLLLTRREKGNQFLPLRLGVFCPTPAVGFSFIYIKYIFIYICYMYK